MNNKSFTLIELLVVIVIIGILAGVIMISTSSSINKANIAKIKVFEESVANNLSANMISRWKMDEGTGIVIADTWGSNTGTLVNSPTWQTEDKCISNNCISFNDAADYVTVPNFNNGSEITVSIWVKFDTFGSHQWIINKRDASSKDQWQLMNYNGYITAAIFGGTSSIVRGEASFPETSANLNIWTHLLFTTTGITGGCLKIFMNGVLQNSVALTGNMFLSTHEVRIGVAGWNTDYGLNGLVDDVKIYDAVLSSSQIKQNYIAGLNSMFANGNMSKEEYNQKIETLSFSIK